MQPLLQWENTKYYIFQECVSVALGIQHAKRMHYTAICGLSCSTIFFHIISCSGMILEKMLLKNEICVLIFCTTFVCSVSHHKKNRANLYRSSCEIPVVVCQILMELEFS